MKSKRLFILAVFISIMLMLVACSQSYDLPPVNEGMSDSSEILALSDAERKIVYYVTLQLETSNFDQSIATIKAELDTNDGYILNYDLFKGNREKQTAEYTLKVKTENLQTFIDNISKDNEVLFESINHEDVSVKYHRVQAEIDAYQAEIALLQDLANAEADAEKKLVYYEKIRELSNELNYYINQVEDFDTNVEYSTVNLMLYEMGSDIPRVDDYGRVITNTFTDSLRILLEILKYILLIIIAIAPFAAVFFAVFFAVKYLLKYLKKRFPQRFEKKKKTTPHGQYYQDFLNQRTQVHQTNPQTNDTEQKTDDKDKEIKH